MKHGHGQGQATDRRPASALSPQPRATRTDKEAEDPEIVVKKKADKVSDFFDRAQYYTHYSWPELKQNIRGADYFPSVTRFYPAQQTAVDMFYNEQEFKAGNTELKAKVLKKLGIGYAYLAPKVPGHDSAATLEDQLKDQ